MYMYERNTPELLSSPLTYTETYIRNIYNRKEMSRINQKYTMQPLSTTPTDGLRMITRQYGVFTLFETALKRLAPAQLVNYFNKTFFCLANINIYYHQQKYVHKSFVQNVFEVGKRNNKERCLLVIQERESNLFATTKPQLSK